MSDPFFDLLDVPSNPDAATPAAPTGGDLFDLFSAPSDPSPAPAFSGLSLFSFDASPPPSSSEAFAPVSLFPTSEFLTPLAASAPLFTQPQPAVSQSIDDFLFTPLPSD